MSKRSEEDMSIDALDEDVETWVDGDDDALRRRGWFGRRKKRAHAAWRKYVEMNIPAEDDADESLPMFLRGLRGRLVFAVATLLLLFGWTLVIASIVL